MQISTLLSLLLFLSSTTQGFEPYPGPISGDGIGTPSVEYSPPSPTLSGSAANAPALPEFPASMESNGGAHGAPVPAPASDEDGGDDSGQSIASCPPPEQTASARTVRWCTVRDDEFVDCQNLTSLLKPSDGYTWQCVKRDTAQGCMDSIKKAQADLANLDAGLAYIAFLNYSMKAIANDIYCNHAESYDAVAVVNRKACEDNHGITLMDFKGQKSCHGGYSTAAGWNYPMSHIKKSFVSKTMTDQEMASSFFSEVCAPSEFEGSGVCSGCGNENGSCNSSSLYFGYSGAFRCLVGGFGDIAFVRSDTALLYSMEGPHNQSWSTKSVTDFMYLCPQGGCREINGYPGSCSFGTVPANVIMSSNSISNEKKRFVLQTLLNDTWVDDLYAGNNGASHLLSSSAQRLSVVKKLTRSYLGISASISQSILELNTKSIVNSVSDVSSPSSASFLQPKSFLPFLIMLSLLA